MSTAHSLVGSNPNSSNVAVGMSTHMDVGVCCGCAPLELVPQDPTLHEQTGTVSRGTRSQGMLDGGRFPSGCSVF